jgi:hypothetical protein
MSFEFADQHELDVVLIPTGTASSASQTSGYSSVARPSSISLPPLPPAPAPLEWTLWCKNYPTTPQALRGVLFGDDTKFWKVHFERNKFIDPVITAWQGGSRAVTYTMPPKGMQGKTWVEGVLF